MPESDRSGNSRQNLFTILLFLLQLVHFVLQTVDLGIKLFLFIFHLLLHLLCTGLSDYFLNGCQRIFQVFLDRIRVP